jgi:enoyl-CoA hydratase/carnithine racemase
MTTTATPIETERAEGVATLWLNRPDRLNALNMPLIEAACAQLAEWELDPAVRCVVLRGRGRSFCAGDDVKGMTNGDTRWETMDYTLRRERGFERLFKSLYHLRKPVVAGLHGHVMGAGAMIALACDLRIVTTDVQFGFPFIKLGITGATSVVVRYTGLGAATELLFTGDPVDGAEAKRLGLANRVIAPDELDAEVERWATRLAAAPTRTLGFMKYALHRAMYQDVDMGFTINSFAGLLSQGTQDAKEGVEAFRNKRRPAFKGM